MSRYSSKELTLWADTLGVSNDDAAMKVLRKAVMRLVAGMDTCAEIAKATADAPDSTVYANARRAQALFQATAETSAAAYHGFKRHARGRG